MKKVKTFNKSEADAYFNSDRYKETQKFYKECLKGCMEHIAKMEKAILDEEKRAQCTATDQK